MYKDFKKLFQTSFIYGLGSIGGSIVGFFLLPIFTRFLHPADYGILEILTTTSSIITIFLIFGMDNSFARFYFDSQTDEYKKQVISTTAIFLICLAGLVIPILLIGSNFLNGFLFGQNNYTFLLQLVFLLSGLTAFFKVPMLLFRIKREAVKYSVISILNVLLVASLSIFFVVGLRKGVLGIMEGRTIAKIIILLVTYYLIRKDLIFGFSLNLLKEMLRYAIPIIPAGLMLWILSLSDRYFLLKLADPVELGLYSVGMRFASIIAIAIGAFRLGWGEFAFSRLNRKDRDIIYSRTLTYFIFVTCLILLGLSLFGKELVMLMTTKEYLRASSVIPILGLGIIFSGCYSIFGIGMNITKKMKAIFPITAIPAGLNMFLNYIFIPLYGMIGAAYTTLFSYFLMAILTWYASQKVYPIQYEWKRAGKIFFAMGAIFVISKIIIIDQFLFSLLFKFGLVGLYFLLLYLIKLPTNGEKEKIKYLISKNIAFLRIR